MMIEAFIEFVGIYYPGYAEEFAEEVLEKFTFELYEFLENYI